MEAEAARRAAAEARAAEEPAAPGHQEEGTAPAPTAVPTTPSTHAQPQQPAAPVPTTTDNNTTKRVRMGPVIEAQSPFPALYRVVKEKGADVWDDNHMTVIRTVPFGVVVLCTTLQYKPEEGFMMRLPDGWCKEDTMVRVRTLASLKQAAKDNRQ